MIKFIHTYTEETIEVLLKSGLFKKGHGLKIMHRPEFTPPYDFNTVAKRGSRLHSLLEELSCPFYTDRLQGGLGQPVNYNYDKDLLREYADNEKFEFLGLQLHEWASNFRSDQKRITELCRKEGIDPAKVHKNKAFWEKVKNGSLPLFLEAYSPEEWSNIPLSLTRKQFTEDCITLYTKRYEDTLGLIFPVDSYYMAFRTEIEKGAKLLLPECGWQIPNMRFQIAFTRGMAKSASIPWGIYYECWHCNEKGQFTIPFSLKDSMDEWREDLLHTATGSDLPFEMREHGGSSLSMMERAWVYAYFSGAEILAEEYGVCNTFRSKTSIELSPYGEVKKRFIELTEEYMPQGEIYTPFAVILPKEMLMPDNRFEENYLEFPPDEFFTAEYMKAFRENAEGIFGKCGKYGNMGSTLRNGGIDICDVIYEDMDKDIDKYPYLIDLTGKEDFRKSHKTFTVNEAKKIAEDILPISTDERLHYTFRKTKKGWEILIMNNDGILKETFFPDKILPEATVTTPLILKNQKASVQKLHGTATLSPTSITLHGGEWMILGITV